MAANTKNVTTASHAPFAWVCTGNTVCENALITAYARQMRSVSPEIIDDIAADFRLGIQTPALETTQASDELNVRKAAQTMLELYAQMKAGQTREEDQRTRVRVRVAEQ